MNKSVLFCILILLLFSVGSVSLVAESDSNDVLVNPNDAVVCGDPNGDGVVNVGDAVFLINYVFKSGPAPWHVGVGDVDSSGYVNVGDAVYLINYIFKSGPEPVCLTIQPIIIVPEDEETVSSPVYVAVENHGIADFSEIERVKIYYSVDNADWIYLATAGPSSENLWEFSIDLDPGFKYIMVIMEAPEEAKTSPSVLVEVV